MSKIYLHDIAINMEPLVEQILCFDDKVKLHGAVRKLSNAVCKMRDLPTDCLLQLNMRNNSEYEVTREGVIAAHNELLELVQIYMTNINVQVQNMYRYE